jgi:hypothetical protein
LAPLAADYLAQDTAADPLLLFAGILFMIGSPFIGVRLAPRADAEADRPPSMLRLGGRSRDRFSAL